MITIEQLKTLKHGDYIYQIERYINPIDKVAGNGMIVRYYLDKEACKPVRWKVNGQVKFWKRTPGKFKLPVKFGLYQYSYVTEENVQLFSLEYTK
jgi:hypothetical protein